MTEGPKGTAIPIKRVDTKKLARYRSYWLPGTVGILGAIILIGATVFSPPPPWWVPPIVTVLGVGGALHLWMWWQWHRLPRFVKEFTLSGGDQT